MQIKALLVQLWAAMWLLCFAPFASLSQGVDLAAFKSLKLRSIGPAGMSGRVTSIAASNTTNPVLYAGTASGGLWKSANAGISWKPIFDMEAVQSIGAVAVAPSNASVVWAGTGEGNPRNSQNSGKGIFRSLDAGRSWKCMGLERTRTIHRIIIDPDDENVVYAAVLGSAWGPNPERGVYKTIDAGVSWERVLFVNDTTGCADLIIDPSNPNKLLAAMWEYHREPWFFTSGGRGSGLYMTLDGGKSWQRQDEKNGLPSGNLGRIGLGICASRPNIVYALVEAKPTALYRSDDGGFSWKKRSENDIGNRPFYYAEFYVDPLNENRIYNLWSVVSLSEDGGKTFSTLMGYNVVHPDHHAWWIDPRNPDFMIDGNDGGLNISRDRGKTWAFVENLPLGQFYHVDYDMETPYNVMGGLQDNGSWVGPSEVWAEGGIRNYHWREVLFGDGFDMAAKRNEPQVMYAMSQGGELNRVNKETGEVIGIRPVHPLGKALRFNWNAAMAMDPFDDGALYFGSQFLHHSSDGGRSWILLSPDLTTNDSTKQKQANSGGLTLDATAAENFTTILAIAPSALQKGLVWVGTDDGNLQLTRDGGQHWDNLMGRLPGAPRGSWIPQIHVSSINVGEAFVVLNDYRRNNWEAYAYHTRDYGQTWRRIADDQRVLGHCLSIVQDPVQENLLFLGTDQGLWLSVDAGDHWTQWKKNFPNVPVNDLKIHPRDHDLIVATFGRALWIMDDIRPLRMLAAQGSPLLARPFLMLPVEDAIQAQYRSVDGIRFNGDADFEGKNAGRGAEFVLYVKQPGKPIPSSKTEEKNKEKKAVDSLKTVNGAPNLASSSAAKAEPKEINILLTILTLAGDTIRHLSMKPDTGFQVIRWNFERDGVNIPQYQKPLGKDLPEGPTVAPGEYRVVAQYQDYRDSANFKVVADPRRPVNPVDVAAREAQIASFSKSASQATQAFDQLREARSMVDRYEKLLDFVSESARDSLKKIAKPVRDSIKTLMELYLDPEDQKGLEHVTVRLVDLYFVTSSYLEPMTESSGDNVASAMRIFAARSRAAVLRINSFLERDWLAYRKTMEVVKVPIFKDLPPVKVE
jgi:photosystem II stability/assembly factor-like uncharacterized protein